MAWGNKLGEGPRDDTDSGTQVDKQLRKRYVIREDANESEARSRLKLTKIII